MSMSLPAALKLCCSSPCDVMETLLGAHNACPIQSAAAEQLS